MRLVLICVLAWPAMALTVSVSGLTNTQAVLVYTAPDSSACTVEVSESATYSPLVHDVDAGTGMFVGANSDARVSGITNGTSRIFVVGARLSQLASDGITTYSRALQANTMHYYRVTCGDNVATGTFTTANIPLNSTYQDIPQVDVAGATTEPTLSTDRTQTIVDPRTGALIRRVSLPADSPYDTGNPATNGPFLSYSGFTPPCGNTLVGSPAIGYLCSFTQGDGGPTALYYIIPSTGESRYLGWSYSIGSINPIDNSFYTNDSGALVQRTYSGPYTSVSPGTWVTFGTTTTLIANLGAAIHAFDSAYTFADFGAGIASAVGDYVFIQGKRGIQDTYGWLAVVRISTASVVAAMRLDSNIQCRWCAIHQTLPMYDQPMMSISTHALVGQSTPLGGGPYVTTYSGGSTLSIGSTTLAVAGEPACAACGADSEVALALAGDQFTFSDNAETVTIITKNSPTSWVISATANTHAPGATLTAACNYNQTFWRFLVDPHGTDTTNTNVKQEPTWPIGGHDDAYTGLRITESTGYPMVVGDLMASVGNTLTRTVSSSPTFAGKLAQCYGDACQAHPSTAHNTAWFTDFLQWSWAGQFNTLSNVSGQLYKNVNTSYPLYPKHHAIAGTTGGNGGGPYPFLDVSGPGATLGTTSGDQYKMCVANAIGECVASPASAVGDVYVNLPGTPASTCASGGNPCIGNFAAYASAAIQVGVTPGSARVITSGLTALRSQNNYPTAKAIAVDPSAPLAAGSWLLFAYGDTQYSKPSQVLMAKLPPFTAGDSVDRTTFVRAPISITPPSGLGIATAVVEFGYLEQGTVAQHYCTSRREACVAVASTVTDANPFWYESTDAYTPASCATSCTITLPVLPAHVTYYQVKYYDGTGTLVASARPQDAGVAMDSIGLAAAIWGRATGRMTGVIK